MFAEREFHPDLRLGLLLRYTLFAASDDRTLRSAKIIRSFIHYLVVKDMLSVYRPKSEYAQTGFSISPINTAILVPIRLPEDVSYQRISPQSQEICPRSPLQPPQPQPQTISPSSTMPSKLTGRRQRKISSPIHYSKNSRTVILQMPFSNYFSNKFPGSTNPVAPMIN